MRTPASLIAILLCFAIPFVLAAKDSGYTVIYDGGSLPGLKSGAKLKMYIEGRMRYMIRFESQSPLPTSVENTTYETLVASLGRIEVFETAQAGYLPTM